LALPSGWIQKESASMRERTWAPARRGAGTLIHKPRLEARAQAGLGQTLVSGDLDAAIADLAPGAPLLGLYALVPDGAHALRIARDRALIVTPAPLEAAEGWRENWCATCVDDGFAAIDIEGADAPSALAQGTAADLALGSPSAAVLFAGLRCLLVRMSAGFRLHVEAPWLEAMLAWLDGV
jgi:sarcosine oxidase gamma subunit